MSAQINLYHERYLKQREWLTLTNVVVVTVALLATLGAAGGWVWRDAAARQMEARAAEANLKQAKTQFEVQTKAAAARKPSPQLAAEVANAESLLQRREQILRLLESGVIGTTAGFADTLRGLARQVPEGLWLTGFTIDGGGNDMEIRGSMLNGGVLPDYIRRLGGEKAFHGRSFAALTLNRPDAPAAAQVPGAPGAAAPRAPTPPPRHLDFVLAPKLETTGGKS
ncbi:MAG: PilN domain-containing protein [Sulfurisoma sp.]|nr:PilN domain-containing protein [Sulfurisoma sp.]